MHRRTPGFTLVEVVIAMLVLAVLLAVAVPAWSGVLARSHAAAARAALLGTLTTAINHAAVTGSEVVLCPATTVDCDNTWDWSRGWIAYADLDGDRRHDAAETLLHAQPALPDDIRLLTSKGRKRLVFQPNGGNAGSNVTFTLCVGGGKDPVASLVLSNTGQLRSSKPSRAQSRLCDQGTPG